MWRLNTNTRWSFTDEGDILDWDEGNEGLGIISRNGHVYTWNDDDYDAHAHFLTDHPDIVPMKHIVIEEDGQCRGSGFQEALDQEDHNLLQDADPRLYVNLGHENTWNFGK